MTVVIYVNCPTVPPTPPKEQSKYRMDAITRLPLLLLVPVTMPMVPRRTDTTTRRGRADMNNENTTPVFENPQLWGSWN